MDFCTVDPPYYGANMQVLSESGSPGLSCWLVRRARQAMTALVATGHLVESAILEWTLTFSAEAMILTLIPALTPSA